MKQRGMDYAIAVLEREREAIVEELRAGRKERLSAMQELDKGLGWLRLLQQHGADQASRYRVEIPPFIENRGFAQYHLVMDYDGCGDMESWKEYVKPDGSCLELTGGGDIILEYSSL